jgi:hypothetical protein
MVILWNMKAVVCIMAEDVIDVNKFTRTVESVDIKSLFCAQWVLNACELWEGFPPVILVLFTILTVLFSLFSEVLGSLGRRTVRLGNLPTTSNVPTVVLTVGLVVVGTEVGVLF